MKWADKRRAWSWRQVRIIRAVADAALAGDLATTNPDKVLDAITEIAILNGRETEMHERLTAWEHDYHIEAA